VAERSQGAHAEAARGEALHALGNQLGAVLGLLDLLVEDTPSTDPRRGDLVDARRTAAEAAETLLALQAMPAGEQAPAVVERQAREDPSCRGSDTVPGPPPVARPAPETAPRVLVVDDQPQILQTMTRFLGSKGYAVTTASTVEEAIVVLGQREIDVVVADVRMPGRSGLELLADMGADERLRRLPAVLLTGAALTAAELAIVARHKAHVFFKPKSYQHLTEYLDRLTRRHRAA